MAQIDDTDYVEGIINAIGRAGHDEAVRSHTGRAASKPCLAVVCEDARHFLFALGLVVGRLHDGDMASDLADFETDNMGKHDTVVYWPDIAYTQQEG